MSSTVAPLPTISLLAGYPAPKEMLVDLTRLEQEYYARQPDIDDPTQLVSFGTSGHRGPSGTKNIYKIYAESFREADHLEAIISEAREMVNHALAP